ncbi:hypothetical protein AVEN_93464-1 [Araneus ventricosus]|uniref:Uncharacterized protein n=1 Tax=Araneus ventricosus TaxID=182803 RepID=A0A4Y2APL5_ARAVE|nr:hypothetical protein AVEN_93464-1 [Araneus ventricosus]
MTLKSQIQKTRTVLHGNNRDFAKIFPTFFFKASPGRTVLNWNAKIKINGISSINYDIVFNWACLVHCARTCWCEYCARRRVDFNKEHECSLQSSLKRRKADYCSVFRSEMIVIYMALDFVLEHQLFGEIWILSDSRSVVRYLDNWRDVSDRRGIDIFNKLKTLCNSCVLHIQWIPSHINLKYNDIAGRLAKEGTTMPQDNVEPLTYLELYSSRKAFANISWRHPPVHSWYRSEGTGATIHFKGVRKDQTALARLTSGHLKTLRFSRGDKKFSMCTRCNMIEATPQHLLDCVVLVYDLLKRPDLLLEVMKANDLMNLILFRSEGLERRRTRRVLNSF